MRGEVGGSENLLHGDILGDFPITLEYRYRLPHGHGSVPGFLCPDVAVRRLSAVTVVCAPADSTRSETFFGALMPPESIFINLDGQLFNGVRGAEIQENTLHEVDIRKSHIVGDDDVSIHHGWGRNIVAVNRAVAVNRGGVDVCVKSLDVHGFIVGMSPREMQPLS